MIAPDATAPSGGRPSDAPIGRQLAEVRLRHRERRIIQVIHELRLRADACVARGEPVPGPLSQALEGFATELAEVRCALEDNGVPQRRRTHRRTARARFS